VTPAIPDCTELCAGHVWPPVKGRSAIATALALPVMRPTVLRNWAPLDAIELVTASQWTIHTTPRWIFDDEHVARRRLLTTVKNVLTRPTMVLDGRSLALSTEPEGWRLWLFTPPTTSVAESLLTALDEGNVKRVAAYVNRTVAALQDLGTNRLLPAGLDGITLHEGRFAILALDEGDGEPGLEPRDPVVELFELLDRRARVDPSVGRWLDTDGIQVLSRARAAQSS